MLRMRLIVGLSLTGLLVALLLVDGHLSTLRPPAWALPLLGIDAGRWLYNGALSTALLAVFVWLAADEVIRLACLLGHQPSRGLSLLGALGLAISPYVIFNSAAAARTGEGWGMFLLAVVLGLAFWLQAVRYGTQNVMVNIGATLLVILYTGGLGHFLGRLRMEVGGQEGAVLLLFSLFVVKITDVGAYFTGRLLGLHKMIPWLSPKKTWEGFVGGVVVAALCAVGVGRALHASGVVRFRVDGCPDVLVLVAFGLLMAVVSAAGDLCASLLKRDAAVKDSGAALPGFGGILDVLDSPLLAAPVAWWFWTGLVTVGAASAA